MTSVKQRAPRRTAHQQRIHDFEERVFQTLRTFQQGKYESSFGVAVGQLSIALTTVLDNVRNAADAVFGARKVK